MSDVNTNLISTLHNVLDKIIASFENNDVEPEHHGILLSLFQSLELLYNNIALNQDEATIVYNWLYHFCKTHSINGASHALVFKLLFTQRIRTQKGDTFVATAKQIEEQLGQLVQEPIEDAEDFKSMTEVPQLETCFIQLCHAVRKQIEDIEYFILKVKGYCAQLKTGGQNEDDRKVCENRMVTTERRICTQLIFIARACIHLANGMQPIGNCTDNFTKLIIQLYICLTNLTKHFVVRHKVSPLSYKSTRFDLLVQTIGKKLPLKIYALINYIEDSIYHDFEAEKDNEAPKQAKKKDGQNNKAKVMKYIYKNIPKVFKNIENFNKFVIQLSKKTEHDLNKLLHIGTQRDFHIKTKVLREAIEKIRENDSDDENNTNEDDEEIIDSEDEDISQAGNVSSLTTTSVTSNVTTSGSVINEVTQHDTSLRTTVMKNLTTINKRANKRKKQDTDNADEPEEVDNRRRKKRKDNEEPDEATAAAEPLTRRSSRRNK